MKFTKKGFTLIEIVITMIIVVIVFGILANLVGFSTNFFRDENTQVANQAALRQVAVTFEKDVRKYALNSSDITDSGTCTTTFVYSIGTNVVYCLESNQTITRNSIVVANGIESFQVTWDSLRVSLSMNTIDDSRGQDVDISYDVYFRN